MANVINLKGKNYLSVNGRIQAFREDHPDWAIITEVVSIDLENKAAQFRCTIMDENGRVMAVAHGSETFGDFKDFAEKAETKSVGRALVYLGYSSDADEGQAPAPAPRPQAPRPQQQAPQPPQRPVQRPTPPSRANLAPADTNDDFGV